LFLIKKRFEKLNVTVYNLKKHEGGFFMNSNIVKDIVYVLKKYEMTMLDEKVMSVATITAIKNLLIHTTRIKGRATLGRPSV